MVRGAHPARTEIVRSLLDFAAGRLKRRGMLDHPTVQNLPDRGTYRAFIGTLDAFRRAGFGFGRISRSATYRQELLRAFPGPGSPEALAVAGALSDPDRLTSALSGFARAVEQEGHPLEAAAVQVIRYEFALLHADARMGLEAARCAGRAFRQAAEWDEALRWYGLARRLAEFEGDFLALVQVLDGIGNTHRERGSFPKARSYYSDAWKMAQVVRTRTKWPTSHSV